MLKGEESHCATRVTLADAALSHASPTLSSSSFTLATNIWDDGYMNDGARVAPPTRHMALENLPSRRALRETAPPQASTSLLEKWISAVVVTVFAAAAGINAAWLNSLWVSVAIIGVAGFVLAVGWERLLGAHIPLPSQIFISLSALVAGIAVAFVQDQSAIYFAFGVLLVILVGIEIWTAPTPRDHSNVVNTDLYEFSEEQLQQLRRNSWLLSSASASLASAMTGLAIAVGGTAWISMGATDSWRLLLPIAAAIVVAVVIGDQIGSTWIGQAMWALASGVTTGAIGAAITISTGQGKTLGHLLLPSLANYLGTQGTVVFLGVGTGVVVAVAVMVIDALLGDHDSQTNILAAASRGAAKFFMCGLVVYTVVRVAGS